jgi:hypothetical protein
MIGGVLGLTLGVRMSGVQGLVEKKELSVHPALGSYIQIGKRKTHHTILPKHSRVPRVLDIVHALRHQSQSQLLVHEQVVQQTPGGVLAVAESRMRRVGVESETQCLPFGNVVVGDGRVVCSRVGVAGAVCDLGHGFDSEDAFEGEVGLVSVRWEMISGFLTINEHLDGSAFLRERTGKVVCRDLVCGNQSFLDQVLGPGV